MKSYKPCIGEIGAADLIDDGRIRSLTESGFVGKVFSIHKVTSK